MSNPDLIFIQIKNFAAQCELKRISANRVIITTDCQPRTPVLAVWPPGLCPTGILLKDIKLKTGQQAAILPLDPEYNESVNQKIIDYLLEFSPLLECPTPGAYYLDLTGTGRLWGPAPQVLDKILAHLHQKLDFIAFGGLAFTKLLAYLAAQAAQPRENKSYNKHASRIITSSMARPFLGKCPLKFLPEFAPNRDPQTIAKLQELNLKTIGDLAVFNYNDFITLFGPEKGRRLYKYVHNTASDQIKRYQKVPFIQAQQIISPPVNDDRLAKRHFFRLTMEVGRQLRQRQLFGAAYQLIIIYQDHYRLLYKKKLTLPTSADQQLYQQILPYLEEALKRRISLQKMILTFNHLLPPFEQTQLFAATHKQTALYPVLDKIRSHFGPQALFYPLV